MNKRYNPPKKRGTSCLAEVPLLLIYINVSKCPESSQVDVMVRNPFSEPEAHA
jgi:hypothetical protein